MEGYYSHDIIIIPTPNCHSWSLEISFPCRVGHITPMNPSLKHASASQRNARMPASQHTTSFRSTGCTSNVRQRCGCPGTGDKTRCVAGRNSRWRRCFGKRSTGSRLLLTPGGSGHSSRGRLHRRRSCCKTSREGLWENGKRLVVISCSGRLRTYKSF